MMDSFVFHLTDGTDVRVVAEDETTAQHKLLSATLDTKPLTIVGGFKLVHTEKGNNS